MPKKKAKPMVIRREVIIDKVGPDFVKTNRSKKVVKKESESNGALVLRTETEFSRLSCGHVAPVGGVCACGRSHCSKCLKQGEAASVCSVCGRFVANCCKVVSVFDPQRVYCRRCRWIGWLHNLVRG